MASIQLDGVSKIFNKKRAVSDIRLDVPDGEFLVLLGPSGCGKSTLLRMLAGLETISEGAIRLNGNRVDTLPPTERDMAFVFQSYALYPNMTVRRNIAFPLMMRRFHWWYHLPVLGYLAKRRLERDPEIRDHVQSVAATLALTEMLDRYPRTLSGGQRQRVALGRAMVRRPEVFLMDEPLSNLDAKLRTTMRSEITKLHKKVGGTFVYVTHDQIEAMTMGSRIALMREGVVQQFATPREIYEKPDNTYVARFIGTPPMNLMHAHVTEGSLQVGGMSLGVDPSALLMESHRDEKDLIIGMRPNAMRCEPPSSPGTIAGKVVLVEHAGAESLITVALDHTRTAHGDATADNEIIVCASGYSPLKPGDTVGVTLDAQHCVLFSPTTGRRISH
ncbi:Diacetylchitobiose uptake system ATP-binding protein MsiK [Castellaniella defragrans]